MVEYTEEELSELKQFINSLGMHLPEDKMGYVWSNYKRIAEIEEPQPCSCNSSAGLWIKAVKTIKDYVNQTE